MNFQIGLRYGLLGAAACMLAAGATVAAAATNNNQVNRTLCKAQGTATRLDVQCPNASVAELLAALQRATGLRSEYPKELGQGRVSVTRRRVSLLEVLDGALSAYNFAIWTDPDSPSLTWVRIVELRRTVAGSEQPLAHVEIAKATPAAAPRKPMPSVPPAALPAPADEDEMARSRDDFAKSVQRGTPLAAPTREAGPAMLPMGTEPVVMRPAQAPQQ